MLFPFVFLIPWGSYRVCITAATGLSLSIKSDRLWHCRLTLTSIHSPLTVLINEKAKRCLFYVYFSSPFRTYCWTIVFQRLCYKILTLFCLQESEKLDQNQIASTSTHINHTDHIVSASMFSGEQRRGTVLSSPRSTRRA